MTTSKEQPIMYSGADISVQLLADFNQLRSLAFKTILNIGTTQGVRTICSKSRRQFNHLLKTYEYNEIIDTISKMFLDEFHQKSVFKYLTLEFCSRPDKFERFYSQAVISTKIVNRTSKVANPFL
jgi:hypothetical protein